MALLNIDGPLQTLSPSSSRVQRTSRRGDGRAESALSQLSISLPYQGSGLPASNGPPWWVLISPSRRQAFSETCLELYPFIFILIFQLLKDCIFVVETSDAYWLQKWQIIVFQAPLPRSGTTFVIPWIAARQASLSFTISRSLLNLMSVKSVMLFNHLLLDCPLLLLPSVFPASGSFSNELAFHIRWPK